MMPDLDVSNRKFFGGKDGGIIVGEGRETKSKHIIYENAMINTILCTS